MIASLPRGPLVLELYYIALYSMTLLNPKAGNPDNKRIHQFDKDPDGAESANELHVTYLLDSIASKFTVAHDTQRTFFHQVFLPR